MLDGSTKASKHAHFVTPPWTEESEEWQRLDQRLPLDHPARQIVRAVASLDLQALWDSYYGVGKKALPPDRLLCLVLYELRIQRPSPAQWARDARECEPVRWLLFGLEPSRARLYEFRDRLSPFLRAWNAQVVRQAVEEERTPAKRVALDSSSVAAQASRRQFFNAERLEKRQAVLEEQLRTGRKGPLPSPWPYWLARTVRGLREQKRRYRRAAEILAERQAANAARPASKRKPAEKVLVSSADPEAILTRDKFNVFRPLYTVQLLRDIDSSWILDYDVVTQNNENGIVEGMLARLIRDLGRTPTALLVDSGYVSLRSLQFCQRSQITLYGSFQENDYSAHNGKRPQQNQYTELPKSAFRWLPAEQCYECPEGQRLFFEKTITQRRLDHTIQLSIYQCAPEHCQSCPRGSTCTKTPQKGRSVSRLENEELLDELQARMSTTEGKQLYKRRKQSVEQNYADMKEHRGLRRYHARGLLRATTETALLVLTHNLFQLTSQPPKPSPPS